MTITFEFFDVEKNNQIWWDKLYDKINTFPNRIWKVNGGCKLGEHNVTFNFTYKSDNTPVIDQQSINEIVWGFIINQTNVDRLIIDGEDVTKMLTNR